ncbi:cysteine proteinase, partial [Dacryopinax primogenitus]
PAPNYDTLSKLMIGHVITFPYENTDMHYRPEYLMRVKPEEAYERQVLPGQGGWCCAQNTLCLGMLRALGYPAYAGAGRVNRFLSAEIDTPAEYKPLCHMVLFVNPEGMETHVVDVGFGGGGLTRPLELREGAEVPGASGERIRLRRSLVPGAVRQAQDACVLSAKRMDKDHWKDLYHFSETEMTLMDMVVLSYSNCAMPGVGSFWYDVVAFFFKIEPGTEEQPEGSEMYRVILTGGKVWEDRKGEKKLIRACESEEDRVQVLKEYFGLTVELEDIRWIQGRAAALANARVIETK